MQEETLTTTASTPAAPRTDRLELVKELVRGSIGVVHKARSPQLDRVTALRQFQVPQWLDDVNDLLQRILAEARAASALDHANIGKLYTCGYKDFNVFVTAEFIEGQTLRELMAARTPDLNEVVAITRQICAGLDYAAEKGVYHHFLNTFNIKVLPGNEVKILDFGLIHDKNLLSQTGTKKLENEPYLSPEQVKNKIPDRASNMFSLATIVYELFTTRNPFAGKHLGEVDRAIGDAMPHPLNVANGRVPEAVSRVVLKAMSKNPADRYASGAQFMAELDQAMREPRMPSKSATGVFPAVGNTTGSFKAVGNTTGSFKAVGNTTSKIPASPVTTRSNVPVPATASAPVRKPVSGPSNQWKIVGGIVAAVVILAALAMVFQRKPADTSEAETTAATTAVAAPATTNATEPVTQETAAVTTTERSPRPASSGRFNQGRRAAQFVKGAGAATPVAADGQITVSALPLGSIIEIEGRSGQWKSPQTIGPLPPGTYKVTVSSPGYAAEARNIQVLPGSRAVMEVRLAASKGFVTVSGTPAGASILVDGKDSGRVTPSELILDPATHTITVHKQGYLDASSDLKLAAGQAISYSPTMLVAGRTDNIRIVNGNKLFGGGNATAGMARIEIKSEPKGAQVIVNGTPLQKPTPVEIQVEAGSYDVTLQKDGFQPIHESVIVGQEDHARIAKTLSR
jgi:eukaryotic-like serine/threonine-protein kinase